MHIAKRQQFLVASFTLLPFFLMAGIALQYLGLFVFAMLIPLVSQKASWKWNLSGVAWLGLYLIFVLSNVIGFFRFSVESWSGSDLLSSPISISIIMSGLLALVAARSQYSGSEREIFSNAFIKGAFWASICLGLYGVIQHFSGIFHVKPFHLDPAKLMDHGRYRITGGHSHPITLAGASLVWLGFFAGLPIHRKNVVCVLVHLAIIVMSGSRFATLVGLGFVGCWLVIRRPRLIVMVLGLSIFLPWSRIYELTGTQFFQADRWKFWQAYAYMIQDSPLFGYSYSGMRLGLRDKVYHSIGYGALVDKYNAHNNYLEVLGCLGIVGTLLFLSILIYLFRHYKGFLDPTLRKSFGLAVGLNLLNSITQNAFFDSAVVNVYVGIFWWLFWIGPSSKSNRQKI